MRKATKDSSDEPKCGLCGKSERLVRTPCCDYWICCDESNYVPFSFARNSCQRHHERYALCAYHHNEGHAGHWKDCKECRDAFQTEIYVWLGTNEYNFEKLENPPAFEPTHCAGCKKVINLATDGYTMSGDRCLCEECAMKDLQGKRRRAKR